MKYGLVITALVAAAYSAAVPGTGHRASTNDSKRTLIGNVPYGQMTDKCVDKKMIAFGIVKHTTSSQRE
jgi:hypothetical protein